MLVQPEPELFFLLNLELHTLQCQVVHGRPFIRHHLDWSTRIVRRSQPATSLRTQKFKRVHRLEQGNREGTTINRAPFAQILHPGFEQRPHGFRPFIDPR